MCLKQRILEFLINKILSVVLVYLDFGVNVAIKSINPVGTLSGKASDLQIVFPRMTEPKPTMSRLPPSKINLQNIRFSMINL